ncbi:unnamed protein product, partial [marine sediment metagenome]
VGIWTCGKCGSKFTGKAYSIKKVITEETEEEMKEEESKEEPKPKKEE